MRVFNQLVFDETVYGNTSMSHVNDQFTKPEWNSILGSFDQLKIHCVAELITGSAPTLNVQIEECADNTNWMGKNSTPEASGSLGSTNVTSFSGLDIDPTLHITVPSLGFVRLRVNLDGTGAIAHVRIYVTGRDDSGATGR